MEEPVLEKNVDDLIEPYMPVKEDGCARVTLSSAIALVNRSFKTISYHRIFTCNVDVSHYSYQN